MNIESINARIKAVNIESKRLNNERQVNMGKRDALRQQLDEALKQYKSKYGVELTEDMIASELERVASEKEAEVAKLEAMINCINRRDYAGARALCGEVEDNKHQDLNVEHKAPVSNVQEVIADVHNAENSNLLDGVEETQAEEVLVTPPVSKDEVSVPVVPPMSREEASVPVAPPNLGAPVMPDLGQQVMPNIGQPSAPNLGDMLPPSYDDSEIPAPPQFGVGLGDTISAPQPRVTAQKVSSFTNILNGSEFNPN